jgi:hypothetical protein
MEEWRPIPSYPDYEASSFGRVRRLTPYRTTYVGRICTQMKCADGHYTVRLSIRGHLKGIGAHRLVCEAFHGPAPSPHHVAAHNNGIPADNVPKNLRWATHAENFADRYLHGTEPVGEKNPNARLTAEEVLLIRSHLMFGERPSLISRLFSIPDGYVSRIKQRKTWKHLEF